MIPRSSLGRGLLATGLALAACAGGCRSEPVTPLVEAGGFANPQPVVASAGAQLQVVIYGEDLLVESLVPKSGIVAVPLCGSISVAQRRADEICQATAECLQGYIRNPLIEVRLTAAQIPKGRDSGDAMAGCAGRAAPSPSLDPATVDAINRALVRDPGPDADVLIQAIEAVIAYQRAAQRYTPKHPVVAEIALRLQRLLPALTHDLTHRSSTVPRYLRRRRQETQAQLAAARNELGPQHPLIVALAMELSFLDALKTQRDPQTDWLEAWIERIETKAVHGAPNPTAGQQRLAELDAEIDGRIPTQADCAQLSHLFAIRIAFLRGLQTAQASRTSTAAALDALALARDRFVRRVECGSAR